MPTTYRACAPAERDDLVDRFGSVCSGVDERAKQALLNFERVWAASSGGKSRYSNGSFQVLYTAMQDEVAIVEKGYWVVEIIFKPLSVDVRLPEYILYRLDVSGDYREYSISDDVRIVHPKDYGYCHQLAEQAVSDGLSYLVVPSARRESGVCVPVFSRADADLDESQIDTLVYVWSATLGQLLVDRNGQVDTVDFDDVFNRANG